MLKLERTSVDNHISVTFRNKEHLFTRQFLTALAIALAIHLTLILIFQISSLKTRWADPHATIVVEADSAINKGNLVTANMSLEELPDNILLWSPPSLPVMPKTPLFSDISHMEQAEGVSTKENLFYEIEKEIYIPAFSQANKTSSSMPVSLFIGGPLSEKKLINPLSQDQINSFLDLNIMTQQHLVYAVLVDERSGRIFWREPIQHTENAALEKIAAAMIDQLQFEENPLGFVAAGQIEMQFSNPSIY